MNDETTWRLSSPHLVPDKVEKPNGKLHILHFPVKTWRTKIVWRVWTEKLREVKTGYLRDAYPRKPVSRREMLPKIAVFHTKPDHTVVPRMQQNWKNYPRSLSFAILRSLDENEFRPAWKLGSGIPRDLLLPIDISISSGWITKIHRRVAPSSAISSVRQNPSCAICHALMFANGPPYLPRCIFANW